MARVPRSRCPQASNRDQTSGADDRAEQHSPDTGEAAEDELADEPEYRRHEKGELADADNARHEPMRNRSEKVAEGGGEATVFGALQRQIHESEDYKRPKKSDRGDRRSYIRPLIGLRHQQRWSRRRYVKHAG